MIPAAQPDDLAVQVHLGKSDLFWSVLVNAIRRPYFWIAPIAVGAIVYDAVSPQRYGWIFALAAALWMLVLIPYLTARASAKQPGVLAPVTYIFSGDGVTAQFENARNSAAWSLVKGARETKSFILIQMQRGSFHLVPKRQLTDGQATRLRQILEAHVPRKVHLSS